MKKAGPEDVGKVNAILNHPDVRPWVFDGNAPLDVTGMTDSLEILLADNGVAIGEHLGNNEYAGIIGVLPEGRGFESRKIMRSFLDYIFFSKDAFRVYGTIDPNNKRSIEFFQSLGATIKRYGERVIAEWDYIQWAFLSPTTKEASVEIDGVLDMDQDTRLMFAAFMLTARAGWAGKAYWWFNRWAYMCRKQQLQVCNEEFTIFTWDGVRFEIGLDYIMEV